MWIARMSPARNVRAIAARHWRALWLLAMWVLVPSICHAQLTAGPTPTTVTTVMKSGLHSFFTDRTALITVSEVGTTRPSSPVRIEFRDDTDRLVAAVDGVLRRGEPVRLRLPIRSDEGVVQVRAVVRITSADEGSVPMTVFEDIGDTLIARIIVCGPPAQRGGGQAFCPGWSLTSIESPGTP